MKLLSLLTLGATIALIASSAFAAEPTAPTDVKTKHANYFKKKDTNGDGSISKEEWLARNNEAFAKIDSNRDGKISADESKVSYEKRAAKRAARQKAKAAAKPVAK
jgi:hypothetical protein